MFKATGSTGCRKGPVSFIFFKVRIVDVENRHCAVVRVGSPARAVGVGRRTVDNGSGDDAGGEVPVFRQRHQHAQPGAHKTRCLHWQAKLSLRPNTSVLS